MLSMDVMHFKSDGLNLSIDADVDQQDNRLQQELKQLIAEQFEDFDLGDDNENASDGSCSSDEAPALFDYDGIDPNTDEVASIQEAGKLSLLEAAIQKFGEDDTHTCQSASEDTTTDHLATPKCFDSKSLVKKPINSKTNRLIGSATCDSNLNGKEKDQINAELWMKTTTATCEIPEFVETATPQTIEGSEAPCFMDKTINWELSLPGEVGNELFVALHKEQDNVVSPLQVTEGYTPPERNASTAVSEEAIRNASPATTAALQQQFSELSGETSSWPRKALSGPMITDPGYAMSAFTNTIPVTPQWVIDEATNLVSEGYVKTVSEPEELHSNFHTTLPLNSDERRELLYAARGRQVEDLLAEVHRLQEEIAKEKRLSNHRATLAEGERESLRSKLLASENTIQSLRKELQDNQEHLTKLTQRLSESEMSNNKLNNELINLRTTNESLSAQLVELTTGDAVRRVEEREGKLTEALERRYSVVAEEVKAELTTANKRLAEKEKEIAALQRQIEVCRSDLKKAQDEYNESIHRANQQLEESQQHCQKLASSVLCTEVTNLRQKVTELETSKKIIDDVNAILQSELRGLREQVSLYEKMLNLDDVPVEDQVQGNLVNDRQSSNGLKHFDVLDPKNDDTALQLSGNQQHYKAHPTSAVEKSTEGHHGSADYTKTNVGITPNANARRAHFTQSDPSVIPEPQLGIDTGHEGFHSLSRQGILTSTPAPQSRMGRLPVEIERCLADCKAKREEITKLHETLFTTRCQLHQATEAAQKAEKNVTTLQDRVLSLEREMAATRELNDTPGPRESALSGQLERLKADYAKLEDELQTTRTRLQTALGAEARALENEKAASERLAASTAERDAAVNRARAVCESHYTAMRRRLEIDWSNERESMERAAEERMNRIRQELNECEANLNRMTKLHQDSQMATQEAVDRALREAMQERENERIRFWREELPKQLESARATWEQEWSCQRDVAIRQAVEEYEKKLSSIRLTAHELSSSDRAQQRSPDVAHIGTVTERIPLRHCASQTETQVLLSTSVAFAKAQGDCHESSPNRLDVRLHLRVLHKFMSSYDLHCLQTQLLETDTLNLHSLDRRFHVFVRRCCKFYSRRSWCSIALELRKFSEELKLDTNDDRYTDLLREKDAYSISNEKICFNSSRSHSPTSVFSGSSDNLSDVETGGVGDGDDINQPVNKPKTGVNRRSVRENVLLHLTQIAQAFNDTRKALDSAMTKQKAEQVVSGPNPTSTDLYNSTLYKIKQEVLNYAETCQTRAAETLHAELARVHRHACRQFTAHLRRALFQAAASTSQPASGDTLCVFPRRSIVCPALRGSGQNVQDVIETPIHRPKSVGSRSRLSADSTENHIHSSISRVSPDLESLLSMINQVCVSTENEFPPISQSNSPTFEPSNSADHSGQYCSSTTPATSRLRCKGISVDLNQLTPFSVSKATQNKSKQKHENNTVGEAVLSSERQVPAHAKASLNRIPIQPGPSSPALPVCQWRKLDDEYPNQVSSSDSPITLPHQKFPGVSKSDSLTQRPVRTFDAYRCKPIPAPRTVKSVIRPVNEPPDCDATAMHTDNSPNDFVASSGRVDAILSAAQLTTETKQHRVHVDLFNLFEQLGGTPGHK